MAGFPRAKRVSDPLNDKVKALIVEKTVYEPVYVRNGSEHDAVNDDGDYDDSLCLSNLIHGFLEDDAAVGGEVGSPNYESGSERYPSVPDPTDVIEHLVNTAFVISSDSFRDSLLAHVSKAMAVFSSLKPHKSDFRRNMMVYLRELGYNAAICKTKWENSGGITSGNYEFIDVIQSDSLASQFHRYFVDLEFAEQFEIARPNSHYKLLLEMLPGVFVGRSDDLKQLVKLISDAAKRSMKSKGLSLPPWRKNRYVQNKWFGTYPRTVNLIPVNLSTVLQPAHSRFSIKCRSVGFDAVKSRLFFPAATRPRLFNQI